MDNEHDDLEQNNEIYREEDEDDDNNIEIGNILDYGEQGNIVEVGRLAMMQLANSQSLEWNDIQKATNDSFNHHPVGYNVAVDGNLSMLHATTANTKSTLYRYKHATANTKSTLYRYKQVYKSFYNFCLLTGDYKSAIILDRSEDTLCSFQPESVSVESCITFLRYNVTHDAKNPTNIIPLTSIQNREEVVVKDIKGNAIMCRGGWKGVSTINIFKSAVSKLHAMYSQHIGNDYVDEVGSRRRGNPTNALSFKDAFKMHVIFVRSNSKEYCRSAQSFLPSEIRAICKYCINQLEEPKYHFMLWTICIIAVKQFLRINEVLLLKVEDFIHTSFVVNDTNVVGLTTKVVGKVDSAVTTLMMWDDVEHPIDSPTRAILTWIKISGITNGYLFPPRDIVNSGLPSLNEHLPYKTVLQFFKKLAPIVGIGRGKNNNEMMSTHSLRKSGYLHGVFGLANWGEEQSSPQHVYSSMSQSMRTSSVVGIWQGDNCIPTSARHQLNSPHVHSYVRDAETLLHMAMNNNVEKEKNRVSKWKSIILYEGHAANRVNRDSIQFQLPIIELVDHYFDHMLKLPPNPNLTYTVKELYKMVLQFKPNTVQQQNHNCQMTARNGNQIQNLLQQLKTRVQSMDVDNAPILSIVSQLEGQLHTQPVQPLHLQENDTQVQQVYLQENERNLRVEDSPIVTPMLTTPASVLNPRAGRALLQHILPGGTIMQSPTSYLVYGSPLPFEELQPASKYLQLPFEDWKSSISNTCDKLESLNIMMNAISMAIASVLREECKAKCSRKSLDGPTRAWVNKVAIPCLCVRVCYANKINDFLDANKGFIYSIYKCSKCKVGKKSAWFMLVSLVRQENRRNR